MERNIDNSKAADETTEKGPRSGNLHGSLRETPGQHFDTPLADAPVNPLGMHGFAPTDVPPVVEKSNNRKKLLIGASAGLAGVALVAGSIMGINASNSGGGETEPPVDDPKGTTEVEEAPEEVAPEKELSFEQQVDALKIEAGQSPEEFSQELSSKLAAWYLAGNDQYLDEWEVAPPEITDGDEIQSRIANEQKLIYANALFIPDWQNTKLAVLAEQKREANQITLVTWIKSVDFDGSWGTPEWEEGNVVERTEVLEEDAELGTRKMFMAGYQTNNGAETKNSDSPNVKLNGRPWSFYVTTTTINGTEYVSDWSVSN